MQGQLLASADSAELSSQLAQEKSQINTFSVELQRQKIQAKRQQL